MDAIANAGIPYIAALHGGAIGLGFDFAAGAHIRVADESSFFSLPEAHHGIFVGGGGSARISRLIGVARMQEMMLTGRCYSAVELQFDVVHYVVPAGSALQKAKELAAVIQMNSPLSNAAILNALPRLSEMSIGDGLFWEQVLLTTLFGGDADSRLARFLNHSKDSLNI